MDRKIHSTASAGFPDAPEISRRRFLLNTTIAGAAVAVAVAPVAAAEPELTPLERVEAAQADLIAKVKIAFPEVDDWRFIMPEDESGNGPSYMFMIVGHNWKAMGRREGGAA